MAAPNGDAASPTSPVPAMGAPRTPAAVGTPVRPGPRTPGGSLAAPSPMRHSPAGSVQSQSPLFARTPRSIGSPLSPLSPRGEALSPGGGQGSPVSERRAPQMARVRGFLGSPHTHPINYLEAEDATGGGEAAGENNFLYGTDINETQVVKDFHKFMQEYKVDGQPYYIQQLLKRWEAQQDKSKGIKFAIDATHIGEFNRSFYDHLVNFPTEVIPIFDRELWRISVKHLEENPQNIGVCQVQVHSLLPNDHKVLRLLNPEHIERLVSVKGIVIRCSDLIPDMTAARFRCTNDVCKHEVVVPLSHWIIEEPTRCEVCGTNGSFAIIHNDCEFSDRQLLKLQEPPELVPDGETPQNVAIVVFDENVDVVRPGDRVEVTGIFRASAVRPIMNWRMVNSVYRTYIDAIAIGYDEAKGKVDTATDDTELAQAQAKRPKLAEKKDLDPHLNTEEDIKWNERVRELAAETDGDGNKTVVKKLISSFAPSIFEEDEVKKGLLCQLFGGTLKHSSFGGGNTRLRPEINQLLCGDPSTAKSQLTQAAYKLAPRGIYTSGKGSSAVGLTASINKDPITKELVLESGALVLSDRGLCCIDEFDKMDENARAVLHEAMEQQTVSIAKAGIICSLNARTAILASANPVDSSYDPKRSVVDNINLPKNLMTRFDLIWLMLDKRNKDTDARLAVHLLSMHNRERVAASQLDTPVSMDLFRRYIAFSRRWVFTELSDKAAQALAAQYIELRNQGGSREVITATPRILESLIRISESLAKMELEEEVTVDHVNEAVRLVKAATYAAAIDPETGLIDMEQLIAGIGAGKRKRKAEIDAMLIECMAEADGETMSLVKLQSTMNERLAEKHENLMNETEFMQAVRAGEQDGRIRRDGKNIMLRADRR